MLRFEFDASTPAEDLADIGFQMVKDALGDRSAGVQYVEYNKASRVIYTLSYAHTAYTQHGVNAWRPPFLW